MAGRRTKYGDDTIDTLVKSLETGATDADACALAGISTTTFYAWQHDPDKPEFPDILTRARAVARALAVKAFRSGLLPSKVVTEVSEETTETRLTRDGKPYDYKFKSERKTVMTNPPDWRAGRDWLERRDKDNWSPRQEVTGKDGAPIALSMTEVMQATGDAE